MSSPISRPISRSGPSQNVATTFSEPPLHLVIAVNSAVFTGVCYFVAAPIFIAAAFHALPIISAPAAVCFLVGGTGLFLLTAVISVYFLLQEAGRHKVPRSSTENEGSPAWSPIHQEDGAPWFPVNGEGGVAAWTPTGRLA